jgi:hypothetical protein
MKAYLVLDLTINDFGAWRRPQASTQMKTAIERGEFLRQREALAIGAGDHLAASGPQLEKSVGHEPACAHRDRSALSRWGAVDEPISPSVVTASQRP